jgi:hypothetical protein
MFSIAGKRTLLDAYKQHAVQMERRILTLHGTWFINHPCTGQRLAEVKPALFSFTPCE